MGTQPPLPKKGAEPPPQFSVHFYCDQTVGCIKMPIGIFGIEVGSAQGTLCSMGTQLPSPQKGAELPPQFSAHVYCGQTAGWIKMALGMEVGIAPSHIVLDGDPAPLTEKGGRAPPIFGPLLLWPNGWMHQDVTWYGGRPRPTRHCVRRRTRSPPLKVTLPNFRPMSVVVKRLHIWIKMSLGTEVGLGLRDIVLNGD